MRAEFRRELRARLMREAAVVLAPKRRRETAWTAWLRPAVLRPALAVSLAALVLVVGAGSAAANSVSGDITFGLKRAIEEVRIALTFDDVERVRLLAEIADQRLAELARVANRSDKAPTASEEYADAVTRFRSAVDALQLAAPEDKSDLAQDVADAAREKHEAILEVLKDRLPERAKDSVDRAIEEERRETPNTKEKQKGGDEQNQGASPKSSPRNTEPTTAPRTSAPRPTERRP
jgi:hypothetical protein